MSFIRFTRKEDKLSGYIVPQASKAKNIDIDGTGGVWIDFETSIAEVTVFISKEDALRLTSQLKEQMAAEK